MRFAYTTFRRARERAHSVYVFVYEHLRKRPVVFSLLYIVAPLYIVAASLFLWVGVPNDFPNHHIVTIEKGTSVAEVATLFKEEGIVRSATTLEFLLRAFSDNGAIAGDYFFDKRMSVFSVARRIAIGAYGLTPIRVQIFEGETRFDIARKLAGLADNFDTEDFLVRTEALEGFLFPDTYFFLPNVKPKEVVQTLQDTFNKRITEIQDEIDAFGKPLNEVVVMASLLEREARQLETKRIIADILWRRIEIDMLLQVDAVFPYILGKNTYEVTLEDLAVDSPYNTYKYKGLPPGAIANPGLNSILAAVTPEPNNYFFYLTGRDGNMYYAVDFDGHKINRAKYLD